MGSIIKFPNDRKASFLWHPKRDANKSGWRMSARPGQVLILSTKRKAAHTRVERGWQDRTPAEHMEWYRLIVSQRFGDRQPKGGVIYKAGVDRENEAIDAYGRGNLHSSVHQYRGHAKWWNRPIPFASDLRDIERYLKTMAGQTVTLGHKSDAFQWLELKYCMTKQILRMANRFGARLKIRTMSDLVAHDEYLDLIRAGGHEVEMHLGVGAKYEDLERELSPGAPSVKRRMKALRQLKAAGVVTTTVTADVEEFLKLPRFSHFRNTANVQ